MLLSFCAVFFKFYVNGDQGVRGRMPPVPTNAQGIAPSDRPTPVLKTARIKKVGNTRAWAESTAWQQYFVSARKCSCRSPAAGRPETSNSVSAIRRRVKLRRPSSNPQGRSSLGKSTERARLREVAEKSRLWCLHGRFEGHYTPHRCGEPERDIWENPAAQNYIDVVS